MPKNNTVIKKDDEQYTININDINDMEGGSGRGRSGVNKPRATGNLKATGKRGATTGKRRPTGVNAKVTAAAVAGILRREAPVDPVDGLIAMLGGLNLINNAPGRPDDSFGQMLAKCISRVYDHPYSKNLRRMVYVEGNQDAYTEVIEGYDFAIEYLKALKRSFLITIQHPNEADPQFPLQVVEPPISQGVQQGILGVIAALTAKRQQQILKNIAEQQRQLSRGVYMRDDGAGPSGMGGGKKKPSKEKKEPKPKKETKSKK